MIFPTIGSFPIHWENGMKLSASHFQHLEDSIEDNTRDGRALGLLANGGFGLIPYSPFRLQNAQGSTPQSVKIVLNACRAFLPGGFRVEILPENIQQLQLPSEAPYVEFTPSQGVRYHLFLSVDEKERKPAGKPQTHPIRYPYLIHDYQLECIPQERLSAAQNLASNRMKIAEWQNGKVIEGYIPPTLSINGFPLLEKWYEFLQNQLGNMIRISLQVIHEHRRKDPARAAFCMPIVHHIRSTQGYYKWALPTQSPIHLLVYFGNLAGLVQGLIETSDRDFIRTQLKDGDKHNLKHTCQELLKMKSPPVENVAIGISKAKKFTEALLLTLQSLIAYNAPNLRQGDRNISSG